MLLDHQCGRGNLRGRVATRVRKICPGQVCKSGDSADRGQDQSQFEEGRSREPNRTGVRHPSPHRTAHSEEPGSWNDRSYEPATFPTSASLLASVMLLIASIAL